MKDFFAVIVLVLIAVFGMYHSPIFNPGEYAGVKNTSLAINGSGYVVDQTPQKSTGTLPVAVSSKPLVATTTKPVATDTGTGKSVVATSTKSTTPAPVVKTPVVPVTTPAPVVATGSFPLDMKDVSAGSTVVVPSVTLAVPGWVAVQDQNAAGNGFGNTMGAQWLPAGTHKNVSVELVRPTIAGKLYFVVVHTDDGDVKYDHVKDVILKTAKGESVAFGFHALAQ